MNSTNAGAKLRTSVGRPPLQSRRLLDQVRERIRYLHYSLSTEQAYVYWVRWYIRFHGVRHPKEMGQQEVERFLTMLADGCSSPGSGLTFDIYTSKNNHLTFNAMRYTMRP